MRRLAAAEFKREPAVAFESSTKADAPNPRVTTGSAIALNLAPPRCSQDLIPIEATNLSREHAIAKAGFGAACGAVYQPLHRHRRLALCPSMLYVLGEFVLLSCAMPETDAGRRPNAFGNKRQNQ
jgi:hypothetical protein